jgi:hypothetical protein
VGNNKNWRCEPAFFAYFLCGGKESKCRPAQGQRMNNDNESRTPAKRTKNSDCVATNNSDCVADKNTHNYDKNLQLPPAQQQPKPLRERTHTKHPVKSRPSQRHLVHRTKPDDAI